MDLTLLFVSLLVAAIVIVVAYVSVKNVGPTNSTMLVGNVTDGKTTTDTNIAVSNSLNQPQGMTFSYSCWILVNDFGYKYGQAKTIFTKGPEDLSHICPGLFVDGTTNSLLVKMDTFGIMEVITIPNVPAKKWIHFALVVDQDGMDIYINGLLDTHRTLAQLPKQNPSTVKFGGFDGKIASFQYFNYALVQDTITSLASKTPENTVQIGSFPTLDSRWYANKK